MSNAGLPREMISTPETSSAAFIAVEDAESYVVAAISKLWRGWCGTSAMPARDVLSPRVLGQWAANISLVRVLDDGADYEFRVIGDAHVQAYGMSYQGRKVSDVVADSPKFGRELRRSYDQVRTRKRPYAIRGLVGRDFPDSRFVWFETAYFPFGADGAVDHVLNAAVYQPRHGTWPG